MPHSLTVTGVSVERYTTRSSALVTAQGARGGPQEWCVHIDRRGNLQSAVRLIPSYAFRESQVIPEAIADAALRAWRQPD